MHTLLDDLLHLIFRMPPNQARATMETAGLKGWRVLTTYHFCCDAKRSNKIENLVIELSKKPKPFVQHPNPYYGFNSTANAKSWMTGLIFGEWLTNIDAMFWCKGWKVFYHWTHFLSIQSLSEPSHIAMSRFIFSIQTWLVYHDPTKPESYKPEKPITTVISLNRSFVATKTILVGQQSKYTTKISWKQ